MSIIVKGMKMPKRCAECLMREPLSDYCELLLRYLDRKELNGRDADCPLAELPEKHGRLIDADAFAEHLRESAEDLGAFALQMATALEAAIRDLKDPKKTPTIVEAEGEEDENEKTD